MHDWAGGRVLQKHPLIRVQVFLHAKCGQRRLVKPAQDQLLLARVGVDVADGEDARYVGFELLGVDCQLLALDAQGQRGTGQKQKRRCTQVADPAKADASKPAGKPPSGITAGYIQFVVGMID